MFRGEKTGIFWVGLTIFCYASVVLFGFLWSFFVYRVSYIYFGDWRDYVPLVFTDLVFLSIGFYMMTSGVEKTSRKLGLMKRRINIRTVFLIILGLALLTVSVAIPPYTTHFLQVAHEEDLGSRENCTFSFEGAVPHKFSLTVANNTDLGQLLNDLYMLGQENVTISYLEGNEVEVPSMWIEGQAIVGIFRFENSGHCMLYWNGLDVTQITVCKNIYEYYETPKRIILMTGLFGLIAGIALTWKTVAFWTGLITFGFALSFLFSTLWSVFAFTWGIGIRAFSDLYVFGSIVFLFIGLYMMIKGIKDRKAPEATRTSAIRHEWESTESTSENQRSLGVTTVAVLTFLSSGALFVLLLMFWGLGARYSTDWSYPPIPIAFILSVYAFFLSLGMFYLRTRYVRYASIVFWIAFLAFFVWLYWGIWLYVFYLEGPLSTFYGVLSVARILVLPSPFVYAAVCLTYFLTRTPRRYFS